MVLNGNGLVANHIWEFSSSNGGFLYSFAILFCNGYMSYAQTVRHAGHNLRFTKVESWEIWPMFRSWTLQFSKTCMTNKFSVFLEGRLQWHFNSSAWESVYSNVPWIKTRFIQDIKLCRVVDIISSGCSLFTVLFLHPVPYKLEFKNQHISKSIILTTKQNTRHVAWLSA